MNLMLADCQRERIPRSRRAPGFFRLLRLAAAVALTLSALHAQQANPPYRSARSYAAGAFGNWQVRGGGPIAQPGWATIEVAPAAVDILGGPSFVPFASGLPVQLVDGDNSEVVVPTVGGCSQQSCTLSANWQRPHVGSYWLRSADGGLQEAIQYAHQRGGGVVVLGPGFTGAAGAAPLAALTQGAPDTLVEDARAGGDTWYAWNGAAYSPSFTIGHSPALLDARAFGASGSGQTVAASCTAGSSLLPLASAADFAPGQGVWVPGCGATAFGGQLPAAPLPEVVNFCGLNGQLACTPGSTIYRYKVAVVDEAGGLTAAGTAGSTATGAANLGFGCCNLTTGANLITWNAPAGIHTNRYGYLVYGERDGDAQYQLIGLVAIPGYARPWQANLGYAMGRFATPVNAPNGSYYVAITAGTSGAAEPAWCSSSATCTVSDGSVVWQRQPFSWMDECTDSTGPTACTAAISWAPGWVPLTPPAAAQSDPLLAVIASGAGTTTLTLNTAAATTSSQAVANHDDTAALQRLVSQQAAACLHYQPSGYAPDVACPPILLPAGTYNVSGTIFTGAALIVDAASHAQIQGQNPFLPLFSGEVNVVKVKNLHTIGSASPYVFTEAADNTMISLLGVDAEFSTDYVAMFLGCGNASCGASAEISGRFVGDRRLAYSALDWLKIAPQTWLEPVYSNSQPWEAQIYGSGAWVAMNGLVGVPQPKPYDRWVDNWTGSVTVNNGTRLGGENGGMSAIYTFAGHGAAPNWSGASLTIRDSSVMNGSAGGAGAPASGTIVALNGSFPQQITVEGDANLLTTALVDTCSGIHVPLAAAACVLPAGFAPTNLDTAFNDTWNQAQPIAIHADTTSNQGLRCLQLQPALLPYVAGPPACMMSAGLPVAGIWSTGSTLEGGPPGFTWNKNPGFGQPLGWILTPTPSGQTVRSAPLWQASHTYTLAASAFGEGDDYVTDGAGHVFHVAGVTSGATCQSGSAPPAWKAASPGDSTSDNGCSWSYDGGAADWLGFGTLSSGSNDTSMHFAATLVTSNANSDTLAVAGLTTAGHCVAQAVNSVAAALTGVTCAVTAGSVVVGHSPTAGGIFDVFITPH